MIAMQDKKEQPIIEQPVIITRQQNSLSSLLAERAIRESKKNYIPFPKTKIL